MRDPYSSLTFFREVKRGLYENNAVVVGVVPTGNMADQRRIEWLKGKTCEGLGLDAELFDDLVGQAEASAIVESFLDGGGHVHLRHY